MIPTGPNVVEFTNERMRNLTQVLDSYRAPKKILDEVRNASSVYKKAKQVYKSEKKPEDLRKENREKISYYLKF